MGNDDIVLITLDELDDQLGADADELASTLATIDEVCGALDADCHRVASVLVRLDDALGTIVGDDADAAARFGVLGASIQLATSGFRRIADLGVRNVTGRSLQDWARLVGTASAGFGAYAASLATVRDAVAAAGTSPTRVVPVLEEARHRSATWRDVLTALAGVDDLVEAVTRVPDADELREGGETSPGTTTAAEPEEDHGTALRLGQRLARHADRAQEVVRDHARSLSSAVGDQALVRRQAEWMVRPFTDLRAAVEGLPDNLALVRDGSELLDLLLELALAQLAPPAGEDAPDADVVRVRVHANVVVPRLAARLRAVQLERARLERAIHRLDEAAAAGQVRPAIHARVVGDYSRRLTTVGAHADVLAASARAWLGTAPSVLDACSQRLEDELAVLDARDLAEDREVAPERRVLLLRERARLGEVRALLEELAPIATDRDTGG